MKLSERRRHRWKLGAAIAVRGGTFTATVPACPLLAQVIKEEGE